MIADKAHCGNYVLHSAINVYIYNIQDVDTVSCDFPAIQTITIKQQTKVCHPVYVYICESYTSEHDNYCCIQPLTGARTNNRDPVCFSLSLHLRYFIQNVYIYICTIYRTICIIIAQYYFLAKSTGQMRHLYIGTGDNTITALQYRPRIIYDPHVSEL